MTTQQAESLVSTPKAEMAAYRLLPTREAARTAVFDCIEGFYNPPRRHSSIGYMSPADYERAIVEEARVAQSEKVSIKPLQFHYDKLFNAFGSTGSGPTISWVWGLAWR